MKADARLELMPAFRLPNLETDDHPHLTAAVHAFWAVCGLVVILFIFFAALGAVDPADALELTVAVLALAVLWLVHAWRELFLDERR